MAEREYAKCVEETLSTYMSAYYTELVSYMENCESPIEQVMALSLNVYRSSWAVTDKCNKLGIEIVDIQAQAKVKAPSGKTYRPDFVIITWNRKKKEGKCFAIECDGHDFHEKTKEQVIHDKQRERDLMETGYFVVRFSGSEICRNPYKCASDTFRIIFRNCMESQS